MKNKELVDLKRKAAEAKKKVIRLNIENLAYESKWDNKMVQIENLFMNNSRGSKR